MLVSVPVYFQELLFIVAALLQTPYHKVGGRYSFSLTTKRFGELKRQLLLLFAECAEKNREFIRPYMAGDVVVIKPEYENIQSYPRIGEVITPSHQGNDRYFRLATELGPFTALKARYEFQGLQHPSCIILNNRSEASGLMAILDSVIWSKQGTFWKERGCEFPIHSEDAANFIHRVKKVAIL